jgi:glycosyltransferase involved in cell wall biosynthesis
MTNDDRSGSARRPLKALFFTQGRRMPSSRFRVLQLQPALERLGIDVTVKAPNPSSGGELDQFPVHGAWRELLRPFSVLSRALQLPAVHDHDVVVVQKPLIYYPVSLFEEYVARARPTVFDLDDAIFHRFLGFERRKTRRIVELCRQVVAGNQYLAEFLDAPEKTTIIPTVVDVHRYAPRPEPDGPLTIGWTGLASNLRELEPLAPVLEQVCRDTGARLMIVAERFTAPFLRGVPVEFVPWTPESEVAALGQVHVGLMPLRDTPYNRGKCGFKLLQYQARGIPVVATPLGANREIVEPGRNGLWADAPEEWRDALMTLARDPDLRAAMGTAGRTRIVQHYSIEAAAPKLAHVLARAVEG